MLSSFVYPVSCIAILLFYNLWILVSRDDDKHDVVGIALTLLLAIVIALRPDATPDTANYIHTYESIAEEIGNAVSDGIWGRYHGIEKGYLILNYLFYSMGVPARVFFFCCTVFNFFVAPLAIKKTHEACSVDISLSAIRCIYISCFGFLYSAATVRAGLVLSLELLVVYLLVQRKYFLSIVGFCGCLILHSTAVAIIPICIMAVLLFGRRMRRSRDIPLFLCAALSVLMLFEYVLNDSVSLSFMISDLLSNTELGTFEQRYIGEQWLGGIGLSTIARAIVVVALFLYFKGRGIEVNPLFAWCVAIGVAMMAFLPDVRAVSRLYDYYFVFIVPILSLFFLDRKESGDISPLYLVSVMMLSAISLRIYF